jgi:deazaflavin-dependent oxidoreductase (nitroreductase family)
VSRAADLRPSRGSRAFGAVTYAVAPLARFRAGRALQHGFTAAHTALVRHFGLAQQIGDVPILLLTTKGRRSGQLRTVPVMYVPGEEPVLVASNGGSPSHPSWYLNLEAEPRVQIEIEGRREEVVARTVDGEEREPLWRRAVAAYPAYASYQRRTDRRLPVVVLSRSGQAPTSTYRLSRSTTSSSSRWLSRTKSASGPLPSGSSCRPR